MRCLDEYIAACGGAALSLVGGLAASGVLDEVEISKLRGRGGAGFPVGVKWRSIAAGTEAANAHVHPARRQADRKR